MGLRDRLPGAKRNEERDVSEPVSNRSLSPTAGVNTAGDVVEAAEADGSDGSTTPNGAADTAARKPADDTTRAQDAAGAGATPTASSKPRTGSKQRAKDAFKHAGEATTFIRAKVATIVWLVALLGAVILGVGALLTALDANPDNGIVSFVIDRANDIKGPFGDIFTFSGDNAIKKQILVNWGLGAIAYLVIGRVLERIIRP